MESLSKNWWKVLQKQRKECSLWNRNTHIIKTELIKKEHSYYQKELILSKRNSSKRNSSKRNTHIIKKELINRNTHINISGLEETLLKGNLYHRNPHASNMDFYNGSVTWSLSSQGDEVLDMLDMICQKAGGQRLSAPEVPLVTCRLIALFHKLIKKEHSYYEIGTHPKGTLVLSNRNSSAWQKQRKECSLWNRNTHIIQKELIKKEHSYY